MLKKQSLSLFSFKRLQQQLYMLNIIFLMSNNMLWQAVKLNAVTGFNIIQILLLNKRQAMLQLLNGKKKNSAILKTDCSCRTFDNSLNRMIRANIVQQSSTWIFRYGYCSSPQGHSKQLSVSGRIHWVRWKEANLSGGDKALFQHG